MAITFFDPYAGLGEGIGKLGEAIIRRNNFKNERAQQLAANPATLKALAPAYRQAKEAGQEANFFAGLQVDPSFSRLLDAYPETEEEMAVKLKNKVDIASATATLNSGIIDKTVESNLLKTEIGTNLMKGYNSYIESLPDTDLGNHFKKMAGVAFANPGLMDEIQRHESTGNKGEGDQLVEYNRWRTAYNDALDRYRDPKNKENKAQLMIDVNNLALLGNQMMQENRIPVAPITGIKEARRFLGLGKKLEEFQITPELINPGAIAVESVLQGKTPEGVPVTVDDLKNSKFYGSLNATDQGKLLAAIESTKAEEATIPEDDESRMSYWDVLGKVVGGPARAAAKVPDKAVEVGLRGAYKAGRVVDSATKPSEAKEAGAPKNNAPAPVADIGRKANDTLSRWAEAKGFTVTSDTIPGGHNTGSLHDRLFAIDVRTRDKTPTQVARLMSDAQKLGLRVLDERRRPPGQGVWGGPHIHIEFNMSEADKRGLGMNDYVSEMLNKIRVEE